VEPESVPSVSGELAADEVVGCSDVDQALALLSRRQAVQPRFGHQLVHGPGFFVIRDAAELAAAALGISRYTIYNYLNEIEAGKRP